MHPDLKRSAEKPALGSLGLVVPCSFTELSVHGRESIHLEQGEKVVARAWVQILKSVWLGWSIYQ